MSNGLDTVHNRELNAELRVTDTHDWVARDGTIWVFVLVTISFDFSNVRAVHAMLVREGDQ